VPLPVGTIFTFSIPPSLSPSSTSLFSHKHSFMCSTLSLLSSLSCRPLLPLVASEISKTLCSCFHIQTVVTFGHIQNALGLHRSNTPTLNLTVSKIIKVSPDCT
jgi:hypothetical protein